MTITAPAMPHPDESFAAGLRRRVELTGWALAYVLITVPALALLILTSVSLGVAIVGVGMVLLIVLVPVLTGLTNVHRALAGYLLGTEIERPYRRSTGRTGFGLLREWAADPARWRDFGWTYASVVAGWALAWIGLGLGLAVIWYLIFPFLWAVTPDGTFETNYGIVTLDTQGEAFLQWSFLIIAGYLWWKLEPLIVRARARLDRALLAPSRDELERRVADVSRTRSETIDHSAAELRRIERDLHDGAQARIAALGMNLGLAEELIASDPQEAARLIAEARESTTSALGDLRSVVRGIHPPVLADRGLVGAVQALALDLTVPVSVLADLPGRAAEPIESAVYFATTELLANVVKHAEATRATVTMTHDGRALTVVVDDDGRGGAASSPGSGLQGVARRLAAFDGTMVLSSPTGGPTTITLEVPCELSSPRTSPSSVTD